MQEASNALEIPYFGKKYPIPDTASLVNFISEMADDVTKIGADSKFHARRLDEMAAGGGDSSGAIAAALALGGTKTPVLSLPPPTTGPASPAQLDERDGPILGTQIVLDTQAIPPTVAVSSGASLGTAGSVAIGGAPGQSMKDSAHVVTIRLGANAANGTDGSVVKVKSGRPWPVGKIPVVVVGGNILGVTTDQSAVSQDASGYITYPLIIPGTLITGLTTISAFIIG